MTHRLAHSYWLELLTTNLYIDVKRVQKIIQDQSIKIYIPWECTGQYVGYHMWTCPQMTSPCGRILPWVCFYKIHTWHSFWYGLLPELHSQGGGLANTHDIDRQFFHSHKIYVTYKIMPDNAFALEYHGTNDNNLFANKIIEKKIVPPTVVQILKNINWISYSMTGSPCPLPNFQQVLFMMLKYIQHVKKLLVTSKYLQNSLQHSGHTRLNRNHKD